MLLNETVIVFEKGSCVSFEKAEREVWKERRRGGGGGREGGM